MTYEIKKNVPLPKNRSAASYPFQQMYVPVPEGSTPRQIQTRMNAAARLAQKKTGMEFTTRQISARVIGVWRVS